MNLFIDDAGSFSWQNKGMSLFAGLTVPDRQLPALLDRFEEWRRTVVGITTRELKGSELTARQLLSFVRTVFPHTQRDLYITLVGASTAHTSEAVIATVRDQVSAQLKTAADLVKRANPDNKRLIQSYTEMAGWVGNRSTQNFLWVNVLEGAVLNTFQHSIAYYMEPANDTEFENIEIRIDRSFIHREQHVVFWKHWLAQAMSNRTGRHDALMTPNTWRERGHPFLRKYRRDGVFYLNDVFINHMHFEDSRNVVGLQVADICAHLSYRYTRHDSDVVPAYTYLRPRIAGKHGTQINIVHFTAEQSIIHDAIENHVTAIDRSESERRRSVPGQ